MHPCNVYKCVEVCVEVYVEEGGYTILHPSRVHKVCNLSMFYVDASVERMHPCTPLMGAHGVQKIF